MHDHLHVARIGNCRPDAKRPRDASRHPENRSEDAHDEAFDEDYCQNALSGRAESPKDRKVTPPVAYRPVHRQEDRRGGYDHCANRNGAQDSLRLANLTIECSEFLVGHDGLHVRPEYTRKGLLLNAVHVRRERTRDDQNGGYRIPSGRVAGCEALVGVEFPVTFNGDIDAQVRRTSCPCEDAHDRIRMTAVGVILLLTGEFWLVAVVCTKSVAGLEPRTQCHR